ncbi:hypothetical protein M3Y94_00082400 [Aphelenchoides besseyi]|nr:hypothetical protein M3Y94_00082400 [Aphelenchoides besseyi]KAI6237773.1 hypothetical protein M3Y95_00300200 [Aphelenchoides besseyi]
MQNCGSTTDGLFSFFPMRWRFWRKRRIDYEISKVQLPAIDQTTIREQPTSSCSHLLPKLDALVRGFDELLEAQRSLIVNRHPELKITDDQMIRPKKKLIVDVHCDTLPLILHYYNNYFGPFKKLGKLQKINLVMESNQEFHFFMKCYLTKHFFPNIEDKRVMNANGYYSNNDFNDVQWFFEGFVQPELVSKYVRVIAPLMRRILPRVTKFKAFGFRKVDAIAMIFLNLWRYVEFKNLLTDEMSEYKEAILTEWMLSLRATYGEAQMTQRFTQLMVFYYECDDAAAETEKAQTVLRAHLIRRDDELLSDVEAKMKKLDIDSIPMIT